MISHRTISLLLTIATIPTLFSPVQSWTYSAYVDLAFPPLSNAGYISRNGTWVDGHGQHDPYFQCALVPVDPNQQRVPFPTTGGRLQLDLTNKTGQLAGYEYTVDFMIGQISGDDSPSQTKWAHAGDAYWKGFATGSDCAGESGINATNLVSTALAEGRDGNGDLPGEVSIFRPELDIVGKNATIGLRIVLFDTHRENVEEMYQCGYVTFVSPAVFADTGVGGLCNKGMMQGGFTTSSIGPLATRTSTSGTTLTTAVQTATHSPSATVGSPKTIDAGSHKSHKLGIGIGVAMGTALLLLVMGGVLLYRRRKAGKTIPLDFFLGFGGRKLRKEELEDGKSKEGKEVVSGSESGSIRSECLPTYTEATEEKGMDDNEKLDVKEKKTGHE